MREILFKGKRVDNGKWVYGYLFRSIKSTVKSVNLGYYIQVIDENLSYISYEVDPETVSQFTGLKDKNGINIFENDIIKHINRNEIYTCVWVEDYACFAFIEDIEFGECYYFQKVDEEKLSIIGNVCDDPDKINSKPQ
jgi:uncharacterized phage protein (TIGR01671 family)